MIIDRDWPKPAARRHATRTILFINAVSGMGGAEHSMLDLIDHLDKKRYRVQAVLLGKGKLKDQLEQRGVGVVIIPINFHALRTLNMRKFLLNIGAWVKMHNTIKKSSADLIHCYSIFALKIYFPALWFSRIPFIQHANNLDNDRFLTYRMATALHATAVTAVSEAVRKKTVSGFPFLRKRVTRISNSVDTSIFFPAKSNSTIRTRLKISQRTFLFGLSARFAPVKDFHTFLRAIEILWKDGFRAHAVLIGDVVNPELFPWDEQYKNDVLSYIRDHNLSSYVHSIGHRDDMPDAYRSLNVLVMPSTNEAFGRSIIEAMASGVPVIAANAGGTPEIITHGDTGLLFTPGNPVDLAEKMKLLYKDKRMYKLLRKNALAEVTSKYRSEDRAQKYEMLYDHLISRKQAHFSANGQ